MRLLVLSFYYKPDLSAGSFRTTALVQSLLELGSEQTTIEVVTTLPNRYRSFSAEAPEIEVDGRVTVHRIALPLHRSGMLDQSRAFFIFARAAYRLARRGRYDLVFATSSRLMTAALGAIVARRARARLYLDIRDIFVDTIKDVMPGRVAGLVRPVFSAVEGFAIRSASKVNLVSRGFAGYFTARYPRQRFSWFTNGIDDEFLLAGSPPAAEGAGSRHVDRIITVVYAGNIGEGQGLHAIIPPLAKELAGRVRFRIIGDGGRRLALERALQARGVDNVELLPPVPRDELIATYRDADVLFLHLNDHDAFKKVLPSKLFEYAAMGKPIWAGVAGYAASFIEEEVSNAAVFAPCDVAAAIRSFEALDLRDAVRGEFLERHGRRRISRDMARDIIDVGRAS